MPLDGLTEVDTNQTNQGVDMHKYFLSLIKVFITVVYCSSSNASIFNPQFDQSSEYAIIGDAGKTNSNSKIVRESILHHGLSQLILPGDNLYSGTYQNVWAPWKSAGMTFDVVAIGNHNDGYNNEIAFFQMPGEYFTKVIHGARFIVLNSDNDNSGVEQATWLGQQLSQAHESLIFLVYHHPTYTTSSFHSWQEKTQFQTALRPILWKFRSKITALFVGHDHLATILHFNDLPVIISGAVQEVRKDTPVNNVQDGVKVQTAWYFDSTPHWAKLQWDAQAGTAEVQFIRAKDDIVTCTAILRTAQKAQLQSDCND